MISKQINVFFWWDLKGKWKQEQQKTQYWPLKSLWQSVIYFSHLHLLSHDCELLLAPGRTSFQVCLKLKQALLSLFWLFGLTSLHGLRQNYFTDIFNEFVRTRQKFYFEFLAQFQTSQWSGKCWPPVIGMFLLQLTMLYVRSEQWSSFGAKRSNPTGSWRHAGQVLNIFSRRSSLQALRLDWRLC